MDLAYIIHLYFQSNSVNGPNIILGQAKRVVWYMLLCYSQNN